MPFGSVMRRLSSICLLAASSSLIRSRSCTLGLLFFSSSFATAADISRLLRCTCAMRREPLRLAWVDTWQLKEKELGVVNVPMVSGMDRKVRGRPAHLQQGKYRLHDSSGKPVATVQARVSVVTHGNALQPELLKQRDYRTAPTQRGLRDDWEPVIRRLVREYHTTKAGHAAAAGPGATAAGVRVADRPASAGRTMSTRATRRLRSASLRKRRIQI